MKKELQLTPTPSYLVLIVLPKPYFPPVARGG